MSGKKVISIVSNCWNEVENIPLFYNRCKAELAKHPAYDYEFIVEDNLSTDGTRDVLRKIAAEDPKFKVILNANNFGISVPRSTLCLMPPGMQCSICAVTCRNRRKCWGNF